MMHYYLSRMEPLPDLPACPFCGGGVKLVVMNGDECVAYAQRAHCECAVCGAAAGAAEGTTKRGGHTDNSTVCTQAVRKWCRRVAK